MKYTAKEIKEILSQILWILFFAMVITFSVLLCVGLQAVVAKARQPKINYIDTTQVNVDVVYENTWGKIILVREEDL